MADLVAEKAGAAAAVRGVATLADLAAPVPGVLVIPPPGDPEGIAFHPQGRVMLPAAGRDGTLFATWTVTASQLNVPVAGGETLRCYLAVDPGLSDRTRARITADGWRLGRPRSRHDPPEGGS